MRAKLLWLTAALLSFALLTLCEPLNVMVAPNLLRVGTSERVFVEIQDHKGNAVRVSISVWNFPQKSSELTSNTVILTAANNFQAAVDIKIPESKNFSSDPLEKQYVYLQASFPSKTLEKVVLLSFQSGYIFIQTDKSIYKPGTTVRYRIFSLRPDLQTVDITREIIMEILTPQGISINRDQITLMGGTKTSSFNIPEVALTGIWTIATWYEDMPQKNFTADFEVKEDVLPSFEVILTPAKRFFYLDDEEFHVHITAKYLFGEDVEGSAFVSFGVKTDYVKHTLPSSLMRVQIIKGEGHAVLTTDMIQDSFPDIHELVGSSLYVSANVLTDTGSEMVKAKKGGIRIVTSPYTIQFRTPKFFHTGISFDVTVYVTNPDQSPAGALDVMFQPGNFVTKTKSNGMAKLRLNTLGTDKTLKISARTADPDISNERQAENTMIAQAYESNVGSNNYLHLSVQEAELRVGDLLHINLYFRSSIPNHDATYLILSKGQIVSGKRFKRRGNSQWTLLIPVTKEMLPSFRVVAFYHIGALEVVADSIWIDVQDRCMGTLKLDVKNQKYFEPKDSFTLMVTGDPSAKVSLVAVDKAVSVLNKNRLKQKQIWDIIEKRDTGCTAGSGKDSMGVFYDAGLLFESDKLGGTAERTAPECPTPLKRKRRAETLVHITNTLLGKYTNTQKQCCADGLKQKRLGYTCERRATFILDGAECVQAFLDCCREVQKLNSEQKDLLALARTNEDDEDFISNEDDDFMTEFFRTRKWFDETWLWNDVFLPACQGNAQCQTTTLTMRDIYLQDSITTWQILAISLSKTHGICVAEPYEITVTKEFFVDLKLPYSAVRNEQLQIKAVLHNFSDLKLMVRVDFMETDNICSAASKQKRYSTIVTVGRKSTISIPYVIIPMDIGEHRIEVLAYSSLVRDGVRKSLKVVSEGERVELPVLNVQLNPSTEPGGIQVVHVKTDVPKGQIPRSPAHVYISVAGHEISQIIEQAISGDFMGRLIVKPYGCGEQTMILMTLPLIATHYLDTTNQWDKIGVNRRDEAINFIRAGYERELAYRKPDGSFSLWTDTPSSTWLTAYVAKMFALASDLININDKVLCSAIKWLVLNAQMPDGLFKESGTVYLGQMIGDIRGEDAHVSMTAFVLIALQEGTPHCIDTVRSLPESSSKAINYLQNKLSTLTNPYAVAVSSYALANAGKLNKQRLLEASSEGGMYWKVAGKHFSLEATAYSLLALVRAKEFDAAGKVVNWLNRQSSPYGGYGTTQATAIVFQAVAEYYKQVRIHQERELDVELSISGRNRKIKWRFNNNNVHVTRSERVNLQQDFNVTATGTGAAVLKVMSVYYARSIEKKSDCQKYDLSVQMTREEGHDESYEVVIDVLFKDPHRDATMTILDIGLLTGFAVNEKDLNDLTSGKDKYIQKFEMDKKLSERGSLIMYLDKVSHTFPDTIAFRMNKVTEVAWLQPAAVKVYEYYSPEKQCMKYYHPVKEEGALSRLCNVQKNLCMCAEENCSIQKKENISDVDRNTKTCARGMDYVYKVKLLNVDQRLNTDYYEMKIERVLKEGSDHSAHNATRTFIGHPHCRESFGFVLGKSYLVMGHRNDLSLIHYGYKQVEYMLGEQTWIEYWPTEQEGQTKDYKEKFEGINALADTLVEIGCTT